MWLHIRASFFASIRRIRTRVGWAMRLGKGGQLVVGCGPSTGGEQLAGVSSGGQQAAVSDSPAGVRNGLGSHR